MTEIGTRVGAIQRADEETVHLYGYGTYEGIAKPPKERRFFGIEKSPKIKLDNGQVLYGIECWWGTEEEIKAIIGGRKVVEVDISSDKEG